MENKTIEQMIPASVLALVRNAPSNRLTRGSVRAAINLVIPEVITTTEDMEKYIVANYDESKIVITPQERAREQRELERNNTLRRIEEERQRMERESLGSFNLEVNEEEYGTCSYRCNTEYNGLVYINPEDILGASSKQEVIDALSAKVNEEYDNGGPDNSDEYDYDNWETCDHGNYSDETDYEYIWEQNKERIAACLGLTVEEMENE